MTQNRPYSDQAVASPDAEERQRIAEANRRLHRDTADHYDTVHPHMVNSFEQRIQREDIALMVKSVQARKPQVRVLDVGCGTGNLTMQFIARGCQVVGADMSREMLHVLRAKLDRLGLPAGQVTLLAADIDTMLGRADAPPYDLISMSSVAHHLPDYLTTLAALAERISPGGFFYLIHEPAHRQELATAMEPLRRLASVLPRGLDRLRTIWDSLGRRTALDWSAQDTNFADYHYHRGGISVALIDERLHPLGFRLLSRSNYNAHHSSLASEIDNAGLAFLRYERFQQTYFRAIFQRA